MFSEGDLQDAPRQQYSLWAKLLFGAPRHPDVEQSSLWRCGGPLISRALLSILHHFRLSVPQVSEGIIVNIFSKALHFSLQETTESSFLF